jgi:hypothetical protein
LANLGRDKYCVAPLVLAGGAFFMARSAALPRARASRKSLAEADEALTAIGLPWAIMAREALHAFVIINRATAPGEVQPDVF